jgi:hypothetical protein
MSDIQISNGWKDKKHLKLLNNAANSLAELGVLSESEVKSIKQAIKEQDDGEIHTSSE